MTKYQLKSVYELQNFRDYKKNDVLNWCIVKLLQRMKLSQSKTIKCTP